MSDYADQDAFLATIRAALTDRGEPIALPDGHEISRVIGGGGDVVSAFAERVEQAKMYAYRVADEEAMIEQVLALVAAVGGSSVVMPAEAMPGGEQLRSRLQQAGIALLDPDDPDAGFSADVGITGVTSAIAETGSMCLTSGGSHRRLASLAVPVHICIVHAGQIVPDLLDWAANQPEALPASEVLVSGPSKTADIELALVMGVHGPREEHVIILG